MSLKGKTPIETPKSKGIEFKSYRWIVRDQVGLPRWEKDRPTRMDLERRIRSYEECELIKQAVDLDTNDLSSTVRSDVRYAPAGPEVPDILAVTQRRQVTA